VDRAGITVRNMLAAIEAPVYDIGGLSDRGMLPGLASIPAEGVLTWLSLLKYRNARGSHIYIRPSGDNRRTEVDKINTRSSTFVMFISPRRGDISRQGANSLTGHFSVLDAVLLCSTSH
jgi:RepB DNA-primase from phage plasmid